MGTSKLSNSIDINSVIGHTNQTAIKNHLAITSKTNNICD